ncbi:MAG: molybdenum cofactor biosynthesis protein MoaE [Leucobacter sp.]
MPEEVTPVSHAATPPETGATALRTGLGAVPYARVTDAPIDEADVRAAVDSPDCGAIVMFHGVIRDHDGGESVRSLDYSAHPEAERFLTDLVREESERIGLRLAAVHRIGSLVVGDVALVAAAAAPHRREAFEAIEHMVERIKHEVPIWKRQHYTSGTSDWVGL